MAKVASDLSLPRLPTALKTTASSRRYKGVRARKWGRWVSEIRIANPRSKIWLGSYSSPEKAARAYDAAVILLRGSSPTLNFPNSQPNLNAPPCPPSRHAIQAAAAAAANADEFPEMPQIFADEELHNCYLDETAESFEMPQIVDDEEQLHNCYLDETAESLEISQIVADEEIHNCRPAEQASTQLRPEGECYSSLQASSLSHTTIFSTHETISFLSPRNFISRPCDAQSPIYEENTFEDLFPFGTLSHYGFTPISDPVTVLERFDMDLEPLTDSCLWNL